MTSIYEEAEKLPFHLLTHCALCGKVYGLVKNEIAFQASMFEGRYSVQGVRLALVDFDMTCSCSETDTKGETTI